MHDGPHREMVWTVSGHMGGKREDCLDWDWWDPLMHVCQVYIWQSTSQPQTTRKAQGKYIHGGGLGPTSKKQEIGQVQFNCHFLISYAIIWILKLGK